MVVGLTEAVEAVGGGDATPKRPLPLVGLLLVSNNPPLCMESIVLPKTGRLGHG